MSNAMQDTGGACCHHHKATPRSEQELRLLQNRLKRMMGQLNGISKMLDEKPLLRGHPHPGGPRWRVRCSPLVTWCCKTTWKPAWWRKIQKGNTPDCGRSGGAHQKVEVRSKV